MAFRSTLSLGTVWVSAVLIATLFAASVVALFRWPRVGFLCVAFFILLAPTSSFIPITTEVGAERRMYLALAALTILAVAGGAWLIDRVRPRIPRRAGDLLPAAAVAAAFAWVGILGVLTMHRNGEFANPVTLWRGSVERWPRGVHGSCTPTRWPTREITTSAIDQLQLAVHDFPKVTIYARDASSRRQAGMTRRLRELSTFIAAEPRAEDQLPARMLLAGIFVDTGRFDEATAEFRRLVELFPSNPGPRERLAGVLLAHGNAADAAVQYRELLRQAPDNAVWQVRLARALALSGRFDEADGGLSTGTDASIRVAVEALTGLAAVLARDRANSTRRRCTRRPRSRSSPTTHRHTTSSVPPARYEGHLDEAIAHFKQAIAIDSNYTEARNNLARAERQLEAPRSIQLR